MSKTAQFYALFAASIAIAAASAGIPYLTDRNDLGVVFSIVLPLEAAWCVVLTFALRRFHARGLWLLVSTPLAFWWPFLLAAIGSACAHNMPGCP